jgi:hypothetical protein
MTSQTPPHDPDWRESQPSQAVREQTEEMRDIVSETGRPGSEGGCSAAVTRKETEMPLDETVIRRARNRSQQPLQHHRSNV